MRVVRIAALVAAVSALGAFAAPAAADVATGPSVHGTSPSAASTMPPAGTVGTLTVGGGGATATPTDRAGNPIGPTVSAPATTFAPSQSDLAAQGIQGSGVIAARAAKRSVHAAAGCTDVDAWRYSTSFLFGMVVYKFHQTVHFCWSTANKLTVVNTGTYVSNVDANWVYRGLTASNGFFFTWCCGVSQSGHYGLREGHFDNCVLKYGCIGSEYPWVKIWVHGNGTWTYATGQ